MPVVNSTQARIELSDAQINALIDHVHAHFAEREDLPPMIFIEETNLNGVVVVGGKGMPTTLLHYNGAVHPLGKTRGN